jgi:V/A-type H+-transporting ATPase subunit I
MRKVTVVGLQAYRDRILTLLHDMRAVQVEPLGEEALSYFISEKGGSVERTIADETLRFKTLASALPPVEVQARAHFPDTRSLLEAAKGVTIDGEVHDLKRKEDELKSLRENLKETRRILVEFSFFDDDLSLLQAKSVFSFFGSLQGAKYGAFRDEVTSLSKDSYVSGPTIDEDGKTSRFIVVVPRDRAEGFAKLAQRHGVRLIAVPSELKGTPSSAIKQLDRRLESVTRELDEVLRQLLRISVKWYQVVLPIEEALVVEARKAEVIGRLGRSKTCFALEGWIPARDLPRLKGELSRITMNQSYVSVSENREGAPTLLTNPKGFKIFEFFIRFYSLPQSGEIDPTLVFAIVFPIFYGFMLGDVGYAGFILAVCLWLIWRIGNKNAGPTIVPRFLVKFTTTVVPPGAMKQLAKALVPGCLIGIALGVTFDSYFGFTLGQLTMGYFNFAIIGPVNGLPAQMVYVAKLLLLSVYIGLGMVTLGLVFGAINCYFNRKWLHVAGKVSWMLVAWGVTLLGLSLVHHYPGSWLISYSQFFYEYLALALVGVGGILVCEGVMAAVELPSIISHVLSYARLVGILLASIILAYVINFITVIGGPGQAPMIAHGIGFAALGIALVLIGALFNIILGVFEPGIQGVRLLYVEYFSKFYTGNGRPFIPFGSARKYTRPEFVEHPPRA